MPCSYSQGRVFTNEKIIIKNLSALIEKLCITLVIDLDALKLLNKFNKI